MLFLKYMLIYNVYKLIIMSQNMKVVWTLMFLKVLAYYIELLVVVAQTILLSFM